MRSTISVTLTYVPASGGGNEGGNAVSGNVVAPTGNMINFSAATEGISTVQDANNCYQLTTLTTALANKAPPGVAYQAYVDPSSLAGYSGGAYCVVQVANPFSATYTLVGGTQTYSGAVLNATPPPTLPRPLVDTDNATGDIYPTAYTDKNGNPIYIQEVLPTTTLAQATNLYTDTPYMELQFNDYNYSYISTFTDTLMWLGGGVWVPLGNWTWSINMGAGYNTVTGKWGSTYTPITTPSYTPTTTYPNWVDNLDYLKTTYKYVETSS